MWWYLVIEVLFSLRISRVGLFPLTARGAPQGVTWTGGRSPANSCRSKSNRKIEGGNHLSARQGVRSRNLGFALTIENRSQPSRRPIRKNTWTATVPQRLGRIRASFSKDITGAAGALLLIFLCSFSGSHSFLSCHEVKN